MIISDSNQTMRKINQTSKDNVTRQCIIIAGIYWTEISSTVLLVPLVKR